MNEMILIGALLLQVLNIFNLWQLIKYTIINRRNDHNINQIFAETSHLHAQISLEKAKRGIPEQCWQCSRPIVAQPAERQSHDIEDQPPLPNPEEPPCDSAAQS
jgi:hypothetical protein